MNTSRINFRACAPYESERVCLPMDLRLTDRRWRTRIEMVWRSFRRGRDRNRSWSRRPFTHHPSSITRIIFIYFDFIYTENIYTYLYCGCVSGSGSISKPDSECRFVLLVGYAHFYSIKSLVERHFRFSIVSETGHSNQSMWTHINRHSDGQPHLHMRCTEAFMMFTNFHVLKHLALIGCDRILWVCFRHHWMIFISVVIYLCCAMASRPAFIWSAE